MVDILNMTLVELEAFVQSLGAPRYRAVQIQSQIYRGKFDFREMSNLPESFRVELDKAAYIGIPKISRVQVSKDGTRKYLFRMADGNGVEAVFMKYEYGNSLCVSSQAGCRMGCKFCASTMNGLSRNLTGGEMLGEVLAASEESGEPINHIVVMGTGEPFDNYDELCRFIEMIHDPKGMGLSKRNITVSTCGLIPMIRRFAGEQPQVNLAISLHAAFDDKRSDIMPINKTYPLEKLIGACKEYTEATRRRITFEYTLVKGVNDGEEDMKQLVKLLKGMLCHVNLIPLNKVAGTGLDPSERESAKAFRIFLEENHIPATVRRELGADIDAACGQLRLNSV